MLKSASFTYFMQQRALRSLFRICFTTHRIKDYIQLKSGARIQKNQVKHTSF